MPAFRTIVVTVDYLDAAKRVYSVALGVEPHTDTPYYVGYNVDGCEFGLSPKPGDGRDGSVPYVDHADIDKAVANPADVILFNIGAKRIRQVARQRQQGLGG